MHTPSRFPRLLLISLAALFGPLAVLAAAGAEASKPEPVTTVDPAISTEHLALRLNPLTQKELEIEAEGWRNLVKSLVAEITEATISAEGSGDAVALEKMQEEKIALLARLDVVLTAWEAKGGDASEYRSYAKVLSGIKIDVTQVGTTQAALTGWIKSREGGIKWALGLLKFAGIMLVFWLLAAIASRMVHRLTDKHLDWSELLERFINKVVKRGVLLIGLLIALSTAGVNVGAMLALIGGSAFIIGFALQDTLGNFASGLMLLIYRPFDVGDVVEVGGVSGKVDHVSLVSTKIKTFDNKIVLVPNKNVWGQTITNATTSGERRIDMTFGIGYEDDISKAQEILEKIVAGADKVLEDPEPTIKMNELADSSVNFICRPWTKTADYWDVYWDITRKVKDEFDAAGISIPYPQRDVHVHQANG